MVHKGKYFIYLFYPFFLATHYPYFSLSLSLHSIESYKSPYIPAYKYAFICLYTIY